MTALITLAAVTLAVLLALGALVALRVRGGATERLVAARRAARVVVTQSDGQSFAGLIADQDVGWLLLREAEQFGPQGSRVAVDGELLIPRERISFMQKP